MNNVEYLPRHPWLDELLAEPQLAVTDLFSGRADKYPYARLRDAEFLRQVLPRREDFESEYDLLEEGLLAWIMERRRENWAARCRHGLSAYVGSLIEMLSAVQMLGLTRVAYQLSEQHNAYLRWLEPLRMGTASDPALELWRCHALLPQDSHLLPRWMHFCVEAGIVRPPTYLTVAMQGLRELPTEQAETNLRYALRALAERYLAHQTSSEASREFKQYSATLRYTYLRNPESWRHAWDQALEGMPGEQSNAVRTLLDEQAQSKSHKSEQKKQHSAQFDPDRFPRRAKELAAELKSRKSFDSLWRKIETLILNTLAHCNQTGDSYYFIRTFCNLGDHVLKRANDKAKYAALLLRWLPDALQWERDNPHVWMLWAQCLEAVDADEQAEWVYWEMRRYFPDDEHCRTELARLLMAQERNEEALALLREAAERNPDNAPSRVELARLLMAQGEAHYPEAEIWLREAAERNPDHEPSRVELARLLMIQGKEHYPEAETWLREAAERNPDHEPSRVELARLLMAQGEAHYPEAEIWLREAAERNPNAAHCQVELARLLSLSGNNTEAIYLLEAFNAKHGGNNFVLTSLQQLCSGMTMHLPRLGEKEHEHKAPARKTQNVAAVAPAAIPDEYAEAAARATRAAFRMALQDQLAQQGRADLTQALMEDTDDLLAAFYLDWAQCLPADYAAPPEAYAFAASNAYRGADTVWENIVKRFPEQRRLTWGLRWLAVLRDGGELPAPETQQLEKLTERFAAEGNLSVGHSQHVQPTHMAGEEILARLWKSLGDRKVKPIASYLDQQAQELIALTINRNLDPVAITTH